ncbi:hypothetical protein EC412_05135 [Salmonella enterica subsp. enterica serovar Redlands]|nr:hypothetical protein [Salmonella enterica subsp. enterica serovar Redlands]
MSNRTSGPADIAECFCKKHPGPVANIESVRLMKGKAIPDWLNRPVFPGESDHFGIMPGI